MHIGQPGRWKIGSPESLKGKNCIEYDTLSGPMVGIDMAVDIRGHSWPPRVS